MKLKPGKLLKSGIFPTKLLLQRKKVLTQKLPAITPGQCVEFNYYFFTI